MECKHYNITRYDSYVCCDDCRSGFRDGTLEYFVLVKRFTYAMSIRNYLIINKKVGKVLKKEMQEIEKELSSDFNTEKEAMDIKSKTEWFFRRNKSIDPNGARIAVCS